MLTRLLPELAQAIPILRRRKRVGEKIPILPIGRRQMRFAMLAELEEHVAIVEWEAIEGFPEKATLESAGIAAMATKRTAVTRVSRRATADTKRNADIKATDASTVPVWNRGDSDCLPIITRRGCDFLDFGFCQARQKFVVPALAGN